MAFAFELLRTRPSAWDPASVAVVLNARMDARIVPEQGRAGGAGPTNGDPAAEEAANAGRPRTAGGGGAGEDAPEHARGGPCLVARGSGRDLDPRQGTGAPGGTSGAACPATGHDEAPAFPGGGSGGGGVSRPACKGGGSGGRMGAGEAGAEGGGQGGRGDGGGGGGARLHYAHLVVLDGLVGEPERAALLDLLTAPGWDHAKARRPAAAAHGSNPGSCPAKLPCPHTGPGRPFAEMHTKESRRGAMCHPRIWHDRQRHRLLLGKGAFFSVTAVLHGPGRRLRGRARQQRGLRARVSAVCAPRRRGRRQASGSARRRTAQACRPPGA